MNRCHDVHGIHVRIHSDMSPAGQIKYNSLDVRNFDFSLSFILTQVFRNFVTSSDDHVAGDSASPTLCCCAEHAQLSRAVFHKLWGLLPCLTE